MRVPAWGRAILMAMPLALAAQRAQSDAPDIVEQSIEIGRFDVMLDQVAAAERLFVRHAVPDRATVAAPANLHLRLQAAVRRYNVLAGRLCAEIALPRADCGGPFEPAWLAERRPADEDPALLRGRIDEAGDRIVAFWSDVCALARPMDEHLCDIE